MLTVYKIPVLIDSVFESKASLPFVEVAACSTSFHVFRIPGVISKHAVSLLLGRFELFILQVSTERDYLAIFIV